MGHYLSKNDDAYESIFTPSRHVHCKPYYWGGGVEEYDGNPDYT